MARVLNSLIKPAVLLYMWGVGACVWLDYSVSGLLSEDEHVLIPRFSDSFYHIHPPQGYLMGHLTRERVGVGTQEHSEMG